MPKQPQPKRLECFSEVSWAVADIRTLRPKWSRKKCAEFLVSIEKNLQGLMIARGWTLIEDELAVLK